MPTLSDLPTEIIQSILALFDSQKVAVSVAQTCHTLHQKAQSYIFKSLVLKHDQAMKCFHTISPETKSIVLTDPDEKRVPRACKTESSSSATSNGSKLDEIKKLSLYCEHAIAIGYFVPWIEQMDNLEELSFQSAYWHWSDFEQGHGETVQRYDEHGWPVKKDKQGWKVDWPFEQSKLNEMFRWNSVLTKQPELRILPALRSCYIQYDEANGQCWFLDCEQVFFSSTITDLTIDGCFFTSDEFEDYLDENKTAIRADLRSSTPLERLSLIDCNVDPEPLTRILMIPKSLKMLHIDQTTHSHHEMAPSHTVALSTQEFVDAIALQRHSLQELYLNDVPYISQHDHYPMETIGLAIDLRDFPNLRKLDLGDWLPSLAVLCTRTPAPEPTQNPNQRGTVLPSSLRCLHVELMDIPRNKDHQPDSVIHIRQMFTDYVAVLKHLRQTQCPELDTLQVPLRLTAWAVWNFTQAWTGNDGVTDDDERDQPVLQIIEGGGGNSNDPLVVKFRAPWADVFHESMQKALSDGVNEVTQAGFKIRLVPQKDVGTRRLGSLFA